MNTRQQPTWRRTPEPLEGEDSWKHSYCLRDAEIPPSWYRAAAWVLTGMGIAAIVLSYVLEVQ